MPDSIQAFLLLQVSEGADVGQAEGETEEILVADIGDGVAAVFKGHAAAVPVVGGLGSGELELAGFRIEAEAGGRAESTAGEAAISEGHAKLVKFAGDLIGVDGRTASAFADRRSVGAGLRDLQESRLR
jgi:hypothetical protein